MNHVGELLSVQFNLSHTVPQTKQAYYAYYWGRDSYSPQSGGKKRIKL